MQVVSDDGDLVSPRFYIFLYFTSSIPWGYFASFTIFLTLHGGKINLPLPGQFFVSTFLLLP